MGRPSDRRVQRREGLGAGPTDAGGLPAGLVAGTLDHAPAIVQHRSDRRIRVATHPSAIIPDVDSPHVRSLHDASLRDPVPHPFQACGVTTAVVSHRLQYVTGQCGIQQGQCHAGVLTHDRADNPLRMPGAQGSALELTRSGVLALLPGTSGTKLRSIPRAAARSTPSIQVVSFSQRVAEAVSRLRPGEVASYGEIAEEAGFPGAARAVGNVLASTDGLPWWRVVRSDGRLVAGHVDGQARLLRDEGVPIVDGRVATRRGKRRR